MYEFVALMAGVALGVCAQRLSPKRCWALVGCGSIVIGVSVAYISGEMAESWAFALFDTAQCLVAATLVVVIGARVGHRGPRVRQSG